MYETILKINERDYKKARENTFLQGDMSLKEEFKGCLFVYDDEFEEYVDGLDGMDYLQEWLYTRWWWHN